MVRRALPSILSVVTSLVVCFIAIAITRGDLAVAVDAYREMFLGGIGNLRGAMAGGLLIGLVELFGAAYLSPHLRDVYVFTLLILVLLFRPEGLLGKATVEKV